VELALAPPPQALAQPTSAAAARSAVIARVMLGA
jgi:hypothetical protein